MGGHINYLELLAAFLAVKTFCSDVTDARASTPTAVGYVNGEGGQKTLCNALAREIWEYGVLSGTFVKVYAICPTG